MSRFAFCVLGLAGCGELAPSPDGGPSDASLETQSTCSTGKFETVLAITELNTPADERGLRFRRNETIGVFSRGAESDAGAIDSSTIIMTAERTSRDSPFSAPSLLFPPNNADLPGCYPTLSEDGRFLFVETSWYSSFQDGVQSSLLVEDATADVDGPVRTDGILVGGGGPGPYGVGRDTGDGFATADGLSYYAAERTAYGPPGIYEVHWAPVTFDEPMSTIYPKPEVSVLASPDGSTSYDDPVLSVDGLTMYLAVRTGTNFSQISITKRTPTSETFGTPTPIAELDYADDQYPTWISADGCRLYLTRKIAGQYDLYVAERSN